MTNIAVSQKKDWLRNYSLVGLLVSVLISSIFYDDPHLFYYKRVVYVIFLYFSIYQLLIFNYGKDQSRKSVRMPAFYSRYIHVFLIFIFLNLIGDFFNPKFNLVTILNNPFSLMAVVPVFAFKVGYQTTDDDKVFKILYYISLFFLLFLLFPVKGNNIYNASIACYASVLPLLAFALVKKQKRIYAIILVCLGLLLSEVSDSRTIILRILMFSTLFVSLNLFKKYSSLKILVILGMCFFIYEVLTDLQTFIDLFVSRTGAKKFDDADTRTFLYQELFSDMKTHELVTGRGFLGTYFSPYFLDQMSQGISDGDSFIRGAIEVGFLQMVLKGGFIYYILYIYPLVLSCHRGLSYFRHNKLSYAISIIILTELLIMFIENIPSFGFPFFLLFFLAGFSYRKAADINTPEYNTTGLAFN